MPNANFKVMSARDSDPGIPIWLWILIGLGVCIPIGLFIYIATYSRSEPALDVQPVDATRTAIVSQDGPHPSTATNGRDSTKESNFQSDSHARKAVGFSADNAAASSDRASFYNAKRDPPYFANERSGHQTRSAAIAALAAQFNQSPAWVEANMGTSNILIEIHKCLSRTWLRSSKTPQVGSVNYAMAQTFRNSWRDEGWGQKSKAEQARALALMITIVRNDITDPDDQRATLDYIQETIGTW